MRVPSADETADAVNRATRALDEMRARIAAEETWAAEQERSAQLARWHDLDRAAEYEMAAGHDERGMDFGY